MIRYGKLSELDVTPGKRGVFVYTEVPKIIPACEMVGHCEVKRNVRVK